MKKQFNNIYSFNISVNGSKIKAHSQNECNQFVYFDLRQLGPFKNHSNRLHQKFGKPLRYRDDNDYAVVYDQLMKFQQNYPYIPTNSYYSVGHRKQVKINQKNKSFYNIFQNAGMILIPNGEKMSMVYITWYEGDWRTFSNQLYSNLDGSFYGALNESNSHFWIKNPVEMAAFVETISNQKGK